MANKLSLNVDQTNFIIFHPPQKSTSHVVKLLIANREIKQEKFIKRMITIHIDFQVLSIISFKALIKNINMQPDWPLRSLIIYRQLGRIMENLISVSVGLNSGMILKKIYNQRVVFALKSF